MGFGGVEVVDALGRQADESQPLRGLLGRGLSASVSWMICSVTAAVAADLLEEIDPQGFAKHRLDLPPEPFVAVSSRCTGPPMSPRRRCSRSVR